MFYPNGIWHDDFFNSLIFTQRASRRLPYAALLRTRDSFTMTSLLWNENCGLELKERSKDHNDTSNKRKPVFLILFIFVRILFTLNRGDSYDNKENENGRNIATTYKKTIESSV